MISSQNAQVSDARVQSLRLKFDFINQSDKLIIQATTFQQNITYVGEIPKQPHIDFQLIKQILYENDFKILNKTQHLLKIRIGATIVELIQKQQSQIKELKQKLEKSISRQSELQKIVRLQKAQFDEYKSLVLDLKKTLEDIKQNPNILVRSIKKQKDLKEGIQKIEEVHEAIEEKKSAQQRDNQLKQLLAQSYKWSQELKSDNLIINGNQITSKNKTNIREFALLQIGFTTEVKQKQRWGIKYNKNNGFTISLGVCLKNIMQKNNFNSQGYGLYLIDENGGYYSHQQKKFKCGNKCIIFNVGDVIYMEYDPIGWKLRFMKNVNGQKFQMPISRPPQNDAYHPFISFYYSKFDVQPSQLQLIYPGMELS